MKTVVAPLLLLFVAATAHAGGFGGPPPFTNGSPLSSGINGNYQAVFQGPNISGIFGFQIEGGTQVTISTTGTDSTSAGNSWVAFVEGNAYQGTTQAGISGSKVSGVLEGSNNSGTNSQITLPLIVSSGFVASGEFTGSINLKSPTGAFSGEGKLVQSGEQAQVISYTDLFTVATSTTTTFSFTDTNGVVTTGTTTDSLNQTNVPLTFTSTIAAQPGFGTQTFNFAGTRNKIGDVSTQ